MNPQPNNPANIKLPALSAALSLLILIGSFGTWVSLSSGTLQRSDAMSGVDVAVASDPTPWLVTSGTVGVNEGVGIVLLAVAGAAAGLAAAVGRPSRRRTLAWFSTVAFGLAAFIAVVDWFSLQAFLSATAPGLFRQANDRAGQDLKLSATIEWGLWVTAGASVAAAAVAFRFARRLAPAVALAPTVARTPLPGARPEAQAPVATSARLGIVEPGEGSREITVSDGQRLVVGRGADADVRVADGRASRQHIEVRLSGSRWAVTDLGATNRARIFSAGATRELPAGGEASLENGQLSIGQAVITLYPVP